VESLPRNSGRDRVPAFIQRQKVPRAVEPVPRPGDVAKHTVLNVFGDVIDGYFIFDRLKVTQDFQPAPWSYLALDDSSRGRRSLGLGTGPLPNLE